ncbi:beta-ketoacyl synthase N-terminal-like domain-containing protein [Kitasatospora sp. NPDC048298]|uniref:beta-ketoacyl synthase N-terminal-like domain-containing protein n=1 Tax=Kitasatospora sp. NPDC048298 TaxID=3364049 RepID=UPI00372080FB
MSAARVAVTGMFLATGLGIGTDQVWRAVCEGDSAIGPCPDLTDVLAARLPEAPAAARLIEEAGRDALRHADLDPASLDPYEIGLTLGTNAESERLWLAYRSASDAHPAHTCADRLGAAIGSRGPKAVFTTGCIAGANAVAHAYDAVAERRATVMLAGGYEALNLTTIATFASWKAIDSAPCAPYGRSGGLNLGEAVAFLVLESEESARARRAPVHAYVLGYGLAGDAHHITAPPPDGAGLRAAMLGALAHTGLTPDAVGYVNGHGTGTPANDTAELSAMRAVFTGPKPPPMSSSKAQLGHTLGACGAVEAVLTALALRDGLLPPTANADGTAPWDVVPAVARPAEVEVALSNSLAFGGASCSLVLGRSAGPAPDCREEAPPVFTGAGVVSPLGVGRGAFLAALRSGRQPGSPGEFEEFVDPRHRARVDGLGALTVAAARMAFEDAGLVSGTRVGIVLATAAGPIGTVEQLNATVGRDGPAYVSAVRAPNVVTSVAAGHAALQLGLAGPLATVSTGDASGLIALGHAADLIRRGQADAVLVVAADQVTDTLARAFHRYGLLGDGAARPYTSSGAPGRLSPGAAAVVLEAPGHARARRATALGELLGQAVTSGPGRSAPLCADSWAAALRRASGPDRGTALDVYGGGWGAPAVDTAEAAAIGSFLAPERTRLTALAGATGHCQSATALLSLIAALDGSPPRLPVSSDVLPAAAPYLRAEPTDGPRPALVSAASWGGTYAAALVGPARGGR